MNIYLVKRKDECNYDEYDSFVCVAENEQAARETYPSSAYPSKWDGNAWVKNSRIDTDWPAPSTLEVLLIGSNNEQTDYGSRVICASFNAG